MITIKNYLDLIDAKHNGNLLDELSEFIEADSKPEAELEIVKLWLKSLHEDSKLEHTCETHGVEMLKPKIMQTEPSDMTYNLDGIILNLKYPSYRVTSVSEMIYTSIKSISTKDQNINFEDLSDMELRKISSMISIEHIKGIKNKIDEIKPVLMFETCCGVKTVVGFKEIMEIL